MASIKKVCINSMLMLLSVFVALLVAEVLLQMFSIKYRFLPSLEPRGYVSYDNEMGYDITPNFPKTTHVFSDFYYEVWSNELGCFDKPLGDIGSYYYLTGDSFVWGWAPFDMKWGKVVESEINTRVLTCGVNGFGTRQELIKTKRDLEKLPRAPQKIILGYLGGNDPDDDRAFPQYTVYGGYRISNHTRCDDALKCVVSEPRLSFVRRVQFFLSTHSVIYNILVRYGKLDSVVRTVAIALFPDAWLEKKGIVHFADNVLVDHDGAIENRRHFDAMSQFVKLSKKYHAELVVVLIPTKDDVKNILSGKNDHNSMMRSYLRGQKIPFLDLTPYYQGYEQRIGESLYWRFDGHWNEKGNRLAGLLVTRYITGNNNLRTKASSAILQKIDKELQDEFGVTMNQ